MKNEVIIGKMLGYIEKVLKYTQGMDYDTFVKQEVISEYNSLFHINMAPAEIVEDTKKGAAAILEHLQERHAVKI